MEQRDKAEVRAAFGKVKGDVHALNRRLDALEGDIMRTIRVNLKDIKDKLADGAISSQEYDARYKRIIDWDLR